jgi:hypothetical protein
MCLPIILNVKNTISLQTFRKKNTARKQNRTNKKNVPPKLKQCITQGTCTKEIRDSVNR